MKKTAFIILGSLFLILTCLGVVLPILPATPFALLTAFFFSRGSPKLYQWCLNLPVIGPAIYDWDTHKVIRFKAKVTASFFMGVGVIFLWSRPEIPLAYKSTVSIILLSVLAFILTRQSEIKHDKN